VTVAVRELWRDRIWVARAWAVVEETSAHAVLANRPGSETRVAVDEKGERLRVPCDDWTLAASRWESWTLCVARPGEPWSTLLFFDEHGGHVSWSVTFEQPLRLTPFGFDTLDHKLDLVVTATGEQRWKDEEELDESARAGVVDAADVRAAARRVVEDPPWPTGWEARPPDTSVAGPGIEGIDQREVEIGWIVDPSRRNRGVATEAARGDPAEIYELRRDRDAA